MIGTKMPEQEPFQQKINERELIDKLVDQLITDVNLVFPDNGDARVRIYFEIADKLFSLHKVLTPQAVSIVEVIQKEK